ncbi:MAG: hypothetical protein EA427_07170 [Spirochaetaceae bacterium]|nr:MAG: hypothetical protein EA427_07170 [Spirochaetaceae bacterium]
MYISGALRFARAAPARTVLPGDVLRMTVFRGDRSAGAKGVPVLRGEGITLRSEALEAFPAGTRLTVRVVSGEPALKLEVISVVKPDTVGTVPGTALTGVEPAEELLSRIFASAGRNPESTMVHHLLSAYTRLYGALDREHSLPRKLKRMRALLELLDRSIEPRTRSTSRRGRVSSGGQGLPGNPEERPMENLLEWFGGSPAGEKRGHGDSHSGRPDEERDDSGDFGRYVRRAASAPDHPLQLYNALAPSGEIHWVVVPLRGTMAGPGGKTEADEPSVEAVLKVGWHVAWRRPVGAVLSVRRDSGTLWWFRWAEKRVGPALTMELVDAGSEGNDRDAPVDPKLLARLGFTGHTGAVEKKLESDGFMLRCERSVPIPRVDTHG